MDLKEIRRDRIMFILVAIAVFQIFLLISLTGANSYFIHQTDGVIETQKEMKKENKLRNLVNLGMNLLIGFLSIKQIGSVSAQETLDRCCEETNDGAICQSVTSDYDSCATDILLNNCDATSVCKPGTCIDDDGEICSSGSPKLECESLGGIWDERAEDEVPQCEQGCCVAGSNTIYTTERRCEVETNDLGSWDPSISEVECRFLSPERGACVFDEGGCLFETEEQCSTDGGDFNSGLLCTAEELGTVCEKVEETKCENGRDEVFFKDSCGNTANIYDALEFDNDDYWAQIQDPPCDDGEGNIKSTTCGACNILLSSSCALASEAGVIPNKGSYACEDLTCKDEEGNPRQNGESWCGYEGYTGDGKDVVGSDHRIRSCNNGEVTTPFVCESYRGQICAEKIEQKSGKDFSIAQCRPNEWYKCPAIEIAGYYDEDGDEIPEGDREVGRQECLEIPDCRVETVDIDDYFKFEVCVPKYPKGSRLTGDSNDICGIASQKCTVSEITVLGIGEGAGDLTVWEPKENVDCLKPEFAEKMNNLCINLGDCGGYVNVEGDYTKNFDVNDYDESFYGGNIGEEIINGYKEYATKENIPANIPQYILRTISDDYSDDLLISFNGSGTDYGEAFRQLGETFFWVGVGGTAVGTLIILFASQAWNPIGWGAAIFFGIVGAVSALLRFLFGIGKTRERVIEFTCKDWKAPLGGDKCGECNNDPARPCTPYKCNSLGSGCEIVNQGTENPLCIYQYEDDAIAPIIIFDSIEGDYIPQEEDDVGVEIANSPPEDIYITELTAMEFSLKTRDENGNDENARCVYNWESVVYDSDDPLDGRDEPILKEGNDFSIIHTFEFTLPLVTDSDVTITGGNVITGQQGELDMYIRCSDQGGNVNVDEYIVKILIGEGEDRNVAIIKEFTPETESSLAFEATQSPLVISLDEPAECKWDHTDRSYESMINSMVCEDYIPGVIKSRWDCSTTLKDLTEIRNDIYIKCEDTNGNINTESFVYTLFSTENSLEIASIFPQGRVNVGSVPISLDLEATTSGGADNGNALCRFSFITPTFGGDYFVETGSKNHKYTFSSLPGGDYDIEIICEDSAGNEARGNSVFNLQVDSTPPEVTRVYRQGSSLKVETDELAQCYYSLSNCIFGFGDDDAKDMTTALSKEHTATWNPENTYHVKCEDIFNVRNSGCAIVVSPSDLI